MSTESDPYIYTGRCCQPRSRRVGFSRLHRGFPEVSSRSWCRIERTECRSGARSTASGSAVVERVALAGPGQDLWNHPMDSNMSTAAFMHRYEKKNIRSIPHAHARTHVYTRSVRVHSSLFVSSSGWGFSRGSLARLSKCCLRGRSMSSLLCRGADRGAWRDPPCHRQNTHERTRILKNRARTD